MAGFLNEVLKPKIPTHSMGHKIEETLRRVIYHQQQKVKIRDITMIQIYSEAKLPATEHVLTQQYEKT